MLAFDLHSHHALATTFAGEKSDQGRGRVLKSVDDILLNLQLPGLDPCAQIDDRPVALVEIVHDNEALHGEALDDDQARYAAGSSRGRSAVILRHSAATGDAAVQVHLEQACFENVAADIVEVDVDALRRRGHAAP